MREIDNPTMLHDGSGWGSMVGVTAAELAVAGFEGAPALTIEGRNAAEYWTDLGNDWLTSKQNIKLFPVCRWAHAPIQAALNLRSEHAVSVDNLANIEIFSFHEATRLASGVPATSSKAQYSIRYPVAAAFVYGQVGAREVSGETFSNPKIADLIALTTISECAECNDNFPQDRLGRTVVTTKDGRRLDSGIVRAPGEHTNPIDRAGIVDKYRSFARPVLGDDRADLIEKAVFGLDDSGAMLRAVNGFLLPFAVTITSRII